MVNCLVGVNGVVNAAAQGGTPVLILSLSVAGVLIVLLLGLAGWLVRDRLKSRARYEELLEKRLSDGAQTMRALKDEIAQLSHNFLSQLGKAITEEKFDAYCHGHETEHTDLDRRVEGLKDLNHELRESMVGMRASLDAFNRILAQLVEVGRIKLPGLPSQAQEKA
jgi:hypothetical protein